MLMGSPGHIKFYGVVLVAGFYLGNREIQIPKPGKATSVSRSSDRVEEGEEEYNRRIQMRLLVHNMLSSNIKGVINGFPLRIEVEKVEEKQVDFDAAFLRKMFLKIEWKALVEAARTMGYAELPEEAPDSSVLESDEELLKKFHHAILEIELEEGALVCPETGRKFPVSKGIPNMLLHEDEV